MKIHRKDDSPACLWMQAGVVKKKQCFKKFDCADCRFDHAMVKFCRSNQDLKNKKPGFMFWKDKLRKNPPAKRLCIHHMKGYIGFKTCQKSYHCIDCEFDQFFHDQFKVYTLLQSVQFDDIRGVSLPVGYYFSQGHTWIKIEDNDLVRMGIDDFACKLLGRFTTLSTPLMGKKLVRGKPAITLTRQEHEVSFITPVNGVITDINTHARKNPDLISKGPYTDGWILTLYCPDLKENLKDLLFMDTSKKFMTASIKHLYEFLEERTQLAAADGGTLISDLYGNLPGISWDELVEEFIPQGS
ncbi:MAG: glycine cleavage system protein H [Desulfobacteraceae bacterium]|nr:glycine cleavage system protein H [Desulfobacteraceae bacterium]